MSRHHLMRSAENIVGRHASLEEGFRIVVKDGLEPVLNVLGADVFPVPKAVEGRQSFEPKPRAAALRRRAGKTTACPGGPGPSTSRLATPGLRLTICVPCQTP